MAAHISLIDAGWRTSSYSDTEPRQCVEVASVASRIAVRDSKDHGAGDLLIPRASWTAFLSLVKRRP